MTSSEHRTVLSNAEIILRNNCQLQGTRLVASRLAMSRCALINSCHPAEEEAEISRVSAKQAMHVTALEVADQYKHFLTAPLELRAQKDTVAIWIGKRRDANQMIAALGVASTWLMVKRGGCHRAIVLFRGQQGSLLK